jgi:hypothetical protein
MYVKQGWTIEILICVLSDNGMRFKCVLFVMCIVVPTVRLALKQIRVSNVRKFAKRVIVMCTVYLIPFIIVLKLKTCFMYHQL